MEQRPTILLVEDDPDVREALANYLSADFDLLVASGGREALSIIAESEIALLLTDIAMPGMSGFQLADEAIAMRPSLRVIYMTGYSHLADDVSRVRHGPLVTKPFRPGEMVAQIRASLAM